MLIREEAHKALCSGIAALPFEVTAAQIAKLEQYLALLNQWNRVHNLTAVRDEVEQVKVHILDCLAIVPYLPEGRLADIGSGAGLPALILAIMQPERAIVAVESSSKKAAFIRQVQSALGLKKVEVVSKRVEAWQDKVDVVVSRAMAEVNLLLDLTKHLAHERTEWWLMKALQEETIRREGFVQHQIEVHVPLLEGKRVLLQVRQQSNGTSRSQSALET
ncbi:MAG: 16S rRNA (guanine(527)-N(7))-methyltransferase RsmG [Cardiobacteriaceae bacterium]|nr:16S rRNA (guanine(527)-N(7))-methyltransferase RsmG [Cardiobacteriaceae bacterium]